MIVDEEDDAQPPCEVLVIPADITKPCSLQIVSTLEEMQKLVGGYIEAVRVDMGRVRDPRLPIGVRFDFAATLYVNEEFRFYPELVENYRASQLYPWSGGIYGDAFLAGPTDMAGNDMPVNKDLVREFLWQIQ